MSKTNLPLASLCVFWAYFIVLDFLCHDCFYLHKTKSRHHSVLCTEADKSHTLSLPSCRFQVVASKLSLSELSREKTGKELYCQPCLRSWCTGWAFYSIQSIYMFVWKLYAPPLPDSDITGTLKSLSCNCLQHKV